MLQRGPSEPPFASGANYRKNGTYGLRDEAAVVTIFSNVRSEQIASKDIPLKVER